MLLVKNTIREGFALESRGILLAVVALTVATAAGLTAAYEPLFAVAAILALPLILALIIWPNMATLLVIFILYTNAAGVAVKFHGVPRIVGAAFPLLLLIPLVYYLVFRRQQLIINRVVPFIFGFIVIQLLGTYFSEYIDRATDELISLMVEGVLLYLLITNTVRTPQMLWRVIWVLLLAGAILGALPFYQQLTGTFDNNYGGFAQVTSAGFRTGEQTLDGEARQFRLGGAIGEQNRYAQIMLMLFPLGLFRFWDERSKFLRLLALIATVLIVIGTALTFSRGVAVGFVLMLIFMVFLRIIKFYQFVLIILGAWLLLTAFPQYGTRLDTLKSIPSLFTGEAATEADEPDGAIKGRATAMWAAVMVFMDHPLIGVGPGMVRYYTQEYGNQLGLRILHEDRQAHSLYLGLLADNGALGLICFLAILYVTLRNLNQTRTYWMQRRPEVANMAAAFMLSLISYMTTGLFLHFSYIRYFWLILALAGAASEVARISTPTETIEER